LPLLGVGVVIAARALREYSTPNPMMLAAAIPPTTHGQIGLSRGGLRLVR
jgi:hypothetical protein